MSSLSSALSSAAGNGQQHGSLIGAWLASYGSANTRGAYRGDLLVLLEHLDVRGVDLLQVRRRDVDLFARTRQQVGDSAATVARRLAAASAFYRYAVAEDALTGNPVAQVRRPVVDADHSVTVALSRREAEDLLITAQEHGPRSHAVVDLLLSTGVRISEALGACVSDMTADQLVITRKGGARAVVYLPDHTCAALRELTGATGQEVARGDEPESLIFTTASGKRWDRTDAARTLRRLGSQAGIGKPVTPHVLRHTHATLALDLGVPLHHLQDSLGHKDPRTTRRYGHSRARLEHSSARVVGKLFS